MIYELDIQNSAKLIRKYALGDYLLLKEIFSKSDEAVLNRSWELAQNEITSIEIISLQNKEESGNNFVNFTLRLDKFRVAWLYLDKEKAYNYLMSDLGENSIQSEKIEEIKFRVSLANEYLKAAQGGRKYEKNYLGEKKKLENVIKIQELRISIRKSINEIGEKRSKKSEERRAKFYSRIPEKFKDPLSTIGFMVGLLLFMTLVILIPSGIMRVVNGFTSVETLTNRYREASSSEYRVGASCQDGSYSYSTGLGTCSHHGGVKKWNIKKVYKKTYSKCREEAIEISWLE